MVLNSRYHLVKLLGDGTFGRVVLAHDKRSDDREVAIKVIRDVKRYMENAKVEADILKDIRKADPEGRSGCCVMYETFTHEQKFYCLVFEPLGVSLYDFLKSNGYRGFWMQDLQSFAQQSMEALRFLHDDLKLTHTDLKPENILLQSVEPPQRSAFPREAEWLNAKGTHASKTAKSLGDYTRPANSRIKLIDFGNATYEDEHHSSIINTRQYRGPEVILEHGWKELSDQWSIGCILMELYSGDQLFETHEEMEHLALMARIIGAFPQQMLDKAGQSVKSKYLAQASGGMRLAWPDKASSASSERHVCSQRPLPEQVPGPHKGLTDFVGDLLRLEPGKRLSAAAALKHPFLEEKYSD